MKPRGQTSSVAAMAAGDSLESDAPNTKAKAVQSDHASESPGVLRWLSHYPVFWLIPVGLVVLFFFTVPLEGYTRHLILHEDGLIELLSALGYFFCALYIARWGGTAFVERNVHLFLVILILGLRELDFHTRFFSTGIFRTRFYVSADVSLLERMVGGLVLLVVLYAAVMTIIRHFGPLMRDLRQRHPGAVAALSAVALAVFAKAIDGVERKLSIFGFVVGRYDELVFMAAEEILELGIPAMLLVSVWYYLKAGLKPGLKPGLKLDKAGKAGTTSGQI